MRLPTPGTNDTLDADALPPTDGTELNYRTRPDPALELPFTLAAVRGSLAAAVAAAVAARALLPADLLGLAVIGLGGLVWLAVPAATRPASEPPHQRWTFRLWLAAVVGGCVAVHVSLPPAAAGYLVAFPCAVAALGGLALAYARQVVAWMAANPRVYGWVGEEWQGFLPRPGRWVGTDALPGTRATVLAPGLLAAAYLFGALVYARLGGSVTPLAPAAAGVGFFVLLGLVVLARRLFGRADGYSLGLVAGTLGALLVVFVSYNRHRTPAAGVFRFPTPALADVDRRRRFVTLSLLTAGLGVAVLLPPVWPPATPERPTQGQLLPHERDYLARLDPDTARRQAAALVRGRTTTADDLRRLDRERWATAGRRAVAGLVAVPAGAVLLVVGVAWVAVGELLAGFHLALEAPGGPARTTDGEWDVYVARLLDSRHPLERQHLLLGFSLYGDYPVLLHRPILDQHYHLTGDTGARKTSLVAGPLATQLMARGDGSVVVLDLKGDMALFESCRIEAGRAGLPFRWFTSERGRSSHTFNPLVQTYHRDVTTEQRAETLIQGLSLDYGMGYGRSFFTAVNEKVLKAALRAVDVRSFAELDGLFQGAHGLAHLTAKDLRDAGHLTAMVGRLAAVAPLNAVRPEGSPRRIEVADVLAAPQVVYFHLKSAQEPLAAASIARLFLWSLFSAAAHRPAGGRRVYLFIDEFQQVIADAVKLVFEQSRGLGVTLVPIHQTGGQLLRPGSDLADTIDSCTAVKHVLRASDLRAVKRIEELSGVQTYQSFAWTQDINASDGLVDPGRAVDGLVQVSEAVGPALDRNTILAASADPLLSFVRFTTAGGYTQFGARTTVLRSVDAVDPDTYERRAAAAWPTLPDDPPEPAEPTRAGPAALPTGPSPAPPPPPPPATDWDKRFRDDFL